VVDVADAFVVDVAVGFVADVAVAFVVDVAVAVAVDRSRSCSSLPLPRGRRRDAPVGGPRAGTPSRVTRRVWIARVVLLNPE
jgi:hypothetical protein